MDGIVERTRLTLAFADRVKDGNGIAELEGTCCCLKTVDRSREEPYALSRKNGERSAAAVATNLRDAP